jgi:hypothetical protein
MAAKKVTALVQSDRMGEDLADIFEPGTASGNQVVSDPQPQLPMNENVSLHKQVQVFSYLTGQRVFHRDHGCAGAPGIESVKDLDGAGAGQHLRFGQQLERCLMTEGPTLALDSNFQNSS